VVYDLSARNLSCMQYVFEPTNVPPKAVLYVCRRGSQYFSSSPSNITQKDYSGIFANCEDHEVRRSLQTSAEVLYLRAESVNADQPLTKIRSEGGESKDSREPALILNDRIFEEINRTLESVALLDQDFFVAFAKQLQVLSVQQIFDRRVIS
jgi:hypothetical protein